jgi:hypothetical protein
MNIPIVHYRKLLWRLSHPIIFIRQSWLVWKDNRRLRGHVKEIHLESRSDIACLIKMKDESGCPIFNMSYDKQKGLQPTLLGKPLYWPKGEDS